MNYYKSNSKKLYILTDFFGIFLSHILTFLIIYLLDFKFNFKILIIVSVVTTLLILLTLLKFNIYKKHIKSFNVIDIIKIATTITIVNSFLILINLFDKINFTHSIAFLMITLFELLFLLGYRMILFMFFKNNDFDSLKTKTLIIVDTNFNYILLKDVLKSNHSEIIGILNDNYSDPSYKLVDFPVLGKVNEINDIIMKYDIEEVILTNLNVVRKEKVDLIEILSKYNNLKIRKIKFFKSGIKESFKIVDVDILDLLNSNLIDLDENELVEFFKDETVLITGGGGSVGSELARQIFVLKPKVLIIFDIYENNAYNIQVELERMKYQNSQFNTKVVTLIGSVYNKKRVHEIFKKYKPSLVFHTAAYKHVPLMEHNAKEAVRTNIIGTKIVADASNIYQVKKMVLVSSDKAVRPTSVMGATKRYAELIICDNNRLGPTEFSAVRFGNVIGSKGSVIPLFSKQIDQGGPVTVTDKNVERYFMTIKEAVSLILQSALYAKGGETFALDMGKAIKIYDIALNMIRLAGFKPNEEINIEITGLRKGEKLREELLINLENTNLKETKHAKIFIESDCDNHFQLEYEYIIENFEDLTNEEIIDWLRQIIISYTPKGGGSNE